jgi:glyoxylase-like metal-dependent hydrolase (beta-lactamase superfamily II)
MQPGQIIDGQSLYVKTNENTVLIDTGHSPGDQKDTGKILKNLETFGVRRTEIDTVILSHAHGDHIGGNADTGGKPIFFNARYIISKQEWQFWTSDPGLKQLDEPEHVKQMFLESVHKNLVSIQDRLDLVDDEIEIVPGIGFIKAPGHTPGLIIPIISSGSAQLYCISDLFHLPIEIEKKDVFSPYDIEPEKARETRFQILSRVAKNNALVFASHLPFPGLGHVQKVNDLCLWQPIQITDNQNISIL